MDEERERIKKLTTIDEELEKRRGEYLQTPVNQIELNDGSTVRELVDNLSGMSIQARNLGRCARIWEGMIADDERPTIFMGMAGPLIAAGLRNVIAGMIRKRMVDVIVSTGAIVYQDLLYARGGEHFIGSPYANNKELRELRINRIYDTFTDDIMFVKTDDYIHQITEKLEPGQYSSREYLAFLSKHVDDEKSILKACHDTGTPVFVPALNDSSIGIGLTKYWSMTKPDERVIIDSIKDNYEMVEIIKQSDSTAGVYIGGGVPKNFINDAIVMANVDFDSPIEGHKYAIQVTTATPQDGGLSGSTLEEAVAWGKVHGEARRATAYVEASIGLPLLYGYLNNEKVWGKREKRRFGL